jgi:hypothetical protein
MQDRPLHLDLPDPKHGDFALGGRSDVIERSGAKRGDDVDVWVDGWGGGERREMLRMLLKVLLGWVV